jgi:hypothetical protein
MGFLASMFFLTFTAGAAERPFYQGKNITFLINYAAGGPTDIVGEDGERLRDRVLRAPPELIDFVRQYVEQARK